VALTTRTPRATVADGSGPNKSEQFAMVRRASFLALLELSHAQAACGSNKRAGGSDAPDCLLLYVALLFAADHRTGVVSIRNEALAARLAWTETRVRRAARALRGLGLLAKLPGSRGRAPVWAVRRDVAEPDTSEDEEASAVPVTGDSADRSPVTAQTSEKPPQVQAGPIACGEQPAKPQMFFSQRKTTFPLKNDVARPSTSARALEGARSCDSVDQRQQTRERARLGDPDPSDEANYPECYRAMYAPGGLFWDAELQRPSKQPPWLLARESPETKGTP
jgi:hypothetical protein